MCRSKIPGVRLLVGTLLGTTVSPSIAVVLDGVSGDGATSASSFFSIDEACAAPTAIGQLGNGGDGEGIARRPVPPQPPTEVSALSPLGRSVLLSLVCLSGFL